jgi:predicted aconitase with swiveling domain
MNTKIALGVVVTHLPAVTDLDQDPFEVIRTGDRLRVDGDRGEVVITRVSR